MKFKVGDKVRVRRYEDMARNYPVDDDGAIDGPDAFFVKEMEELCGKVATISTVCTHRIYFEDNEITDHWHICEWMLEPIESDESNW